MPMSARGWINLSCFVIIVAGPWLIIWLFGR